MTGGSVEPPTGYGVAYRSIFPESHFRTTTESYFQPCWGRGSLRELGSTPPARFGDAERSPRHVPPQRDLLSTRSGARNRRRFGAEPVSVWPRSGSRCWSRSLARIAASRRQASGSSTRSCLAGQSFGRRYSIRRRDLRCDLDDLDVVFDPEPDCGAHRDATGSEAGRAIGVRGTRLVAGNSDCSVAT